MDAKSSLPPLPPPSWVTALHTPLPRPSKESANIPNPPGFTSGRPSKQVCLPTLTLLYTVNKLTKPLPFQQQRAQQQQQPQQPTPPKPVETDTLKLKKAWEIALAPSKQIPMNAIMMYMSGNSLQIFSIMMVFMLFKGPIQGLLSTNSVFAKFDSEGTRAKLVGVKAVYVLMQLGLLALGVWKVNAMGLLPYVFSLFSFYLV